MTASSSPSERIRTRRRARRRRISAPCGGSPSIPKCVGIGEAGLDYHYNYAPPEVAQRVFRGQIALARELGLPIVIHTREAEDDTAAILKDEMGQGPFDALLHCFTSSRALAETALGLGFSISFSGVVTFKNSDDLRAIARDVPLDRILVETDAPYLAPGSASRQAQRAGVRRRDREGGRGSEGHRARSARGGDPRQYAAGFPEARPRRLPALSLRLTILGCGSSAGVPRVGQGWGACDPANPRNRRRRCSALVERVGEGGVTTALVDTGPDLREQLIDADVRRVDAVLLTHPHADHTHGIDDLRPLYLQAGRRIDMHMDEPTALTVRNGFSYIFRTPDGSSYPPIATDLRLAAGNPVPNRGDGRSDRGDAVRPRPRRDQRARVPLRRARLYP